MSKIYHPKPIEEWHYHWVQVTKKEDIVLFSETGNSDDCPFFAIICTKNKSVDQLKRECQNIYSRLLIDIGTNPTNYIIP